MITFDKKWHYLTFKKFAALFRRIILNHAGDFSCLNCFHSFITKIMLKSMEMYVKIMTIVIQKRQKKNNNIIMEKCL